jgi:hypothetical protein
MQDDTATGQTFEEAAAASHPSAYRALEAAGVTNALAL